jgi:hypothetical protein
VETSVTRYRSHRKQSVLGTKFFRTTVNRLQADRIMENRRVPMRMDVADEPDLPENHRSTGNCIIHRSLCTCSRLMTIRSGPREFGPHRF